MTSIVDIALSTIAPHICKGCKRVGSTLCDRCICNILRSSYRLCTYCGNAVQNGSLCSSCRRLSSNQFCNIIAVGERSGALERLVGDYKFNSERESADILAKLLENTIPTSWNYQQIAYIPTVPAHIRERGFDHMKLIATKLARDYNKPLCQPLVRTNNHTQHGSSYINRKTKIRSSLVAKPISKPPHSILLIDDIWTTGSTLNTAAALLHRIGVQNVYGAVIAVQPK